MHLPMKPTILLFCISLTMISSGDTPSVQYPSWSQKPAIFSCNFDSIEYSKILLARGHSGNGYQFCGKDSFLKFPMPKNFNMAEGTVAFWVKPLKSVTSGKSSRVLFDTIGQPFWWGRYMMEITPGKLQVNIVSNSLKQDATLSQVDNVLSADISTWEKNSWHHVGVTWSGINSGGESAMIYIFIDGVQAECLARPAKIDIKKTGESFTLGNSFFAEYHAASDVVMDDVEIYDSPKSPEEFGVIFEKYFSNDKRMNK